MCVGYVWICVETRGNGSELNRKAVEELGHAFQEMDLICSD